jgi:hypothetical protein
MSETLDLTGPDETASPRRAGEHVGWHRAHYQED